MQRHEHLRGSHRPVVSEQPRLQRFAAGADYRPRVVRGHHGIADPLEHGGRDHRTEPPGGDRVCACGHREVVTERFAPRSDDVVGRPAFGIDVPGPRLPASARTPARSSGVRSKSTGSRTATIPWSAVTISAESGAAAPRASVPRGRSDPTPAPRIPSPDAGRIRSAMVQQPVTRRPRGFPILLGVLLLSVASASPAPHSPGAETATASSPALPRSGSGTSPRPA